MENINTKMLRATKWTTITEFIAKLVIPISNMILARLLAPEAFGVVATVTMIISFADMFSDSGFQKYLIQREFKNKNETFEFANVAFWTNLIISLIIYGIIIIFSDRIANLVGSDGLGNVIIIACLQLPITAISSIQIALYRRDFNFKVLFYNRLIIIISPFLITIPLAFFGFNYWSLIIGNLISSFVSAFLLTITSSWKPKLRYNFEILKKMFSFSIWTLFESVAIWLTTWIDTFVIGNVLSSYYLGVYKTSTSLVNSLMSIVTAATTPILFSGLSRLQNSEKEFEDLFYNFQKIVAMLIIPLGVGLFSYRELATKIMLGNKWLEASFIVGIWSLTSVLVILFSHFSSEVYRSLGRPKLSLVAQLLHLVFLIPTLLISVKYGFMTLVIARSLIRLQAILVHFFIMHFVINISVLKSLKNMLPIFLSVTIMYLFSVIFNRNYQTILMQFIGIILCIIIYFAVLILFKEQRNQIKYFIYKVRRKEL